jgi:hypothetical protein
MQQEVYTWKLKWQNQKEANIDENKLQQEVYT